MFFKGFYKGFAFKIHIILKKDRMIANLVVKLENSFLKRQQTLYCVYAKLCFALLLHCQ